MEEPFGTEQEIRRFVAIFASAIRKMLDPSKLGEPSPAEKMLIQSAMQSIREIKGNPIMPKPGESTVISVHAPKTAALAFDRVYRLPAILVPDEIAFYGSSGVENLLFCTTTLFVAAHKLPELKAFGDNMPQSQAADACNSFVRNIGEACQQSYGLTPTLHYMDYHSQAHDFHGDGFCALTSAIKNVALVEEASLEWPQVSEFRKDEIARKKYRRFMRWVDTDLKSKSPKEVEDIISIRLDDYEWVIKKHGLKTSLGTLSCLLDPKFLGGASMASMGAGLAGGPILGSLLGAALTIGKLAVEFGTAKVNAIDDQRSKNYEIAYVHELKKKLGGRHTT